MKHITWILVASLLLATSSVFADDTELLMRRANRFFSPLPDAMPGSENDTPERIALGKKLYFEKRLSINDSQSCATCHRLEEGYAGVDNLATSPGARGEQGTRNSPTVLNAGWQDSQFWDGRAEDLVEQAKGPILNPIEMGMPDEQTVEKKIQAIAEYRDAFALAFPGDEKTGFEREVLFPMAGLDPKLADQLESLNKLTLELGFSRVASMQLYLDGEISREEAIERTRKYGLTSRDRAEKSVSFAEQYRSYILNYSVGKALVQAYIERQANDPVGRWKAFERMLVEMPTASELVASP